MTVTQFPDPRQTGPDGLLAWGGDLEPASLLLAYRQGIFPWPLTVPAQGSRPAHSVLAWFSPPVRAILEFNRLHLPRSLSRTLRRAPYRLTVNQAFSEVIRACANQPRPGQPGTWITPEMIQAYIELHRLGHARSVEAWEDTPSGPELVGGIYGVSVEGAFAGESMFHLRPNASKLALLHLVEQIRAQGLEWMDIQVMTPHLKALGAREISRDEFLEKLSRTRSRSLGSHPSQ